MIFLQPKRNKRKASAGFSLLELILVLGLVFALSSLILPGLNLFINHTHADIAATEFMEILHWARNQAEVNQATIGLCQSNDLKKCEYQGSSLIVFLDQYGNGLIKNQNQILLTKKLSNKVVLHWRSFPFYRKYILFLSNANGNNNDNATFWFCLTKEKRPSWGITLSKSGLVNVLKSDVSKQIKDSHGDFLKC